MYHLGESWETVHKIPVHERHWILERFAEQKRKEEEEYKKQSASSRSGSRGF